MLPKVAYHGMPYFIFLKYLDSLEDFRKTPHVKIPPKSPCANFQSLGIFKNSIFIRKGIFFGFWPIRPIPACAGPLRPAGRQIPAQPIRPKQFWRICRKAYFLRLCAFRQRRLLSLTSLPCGARLLASSPSPRHFSSSPPASLRRPASNLEMPSEVFTPHLDSPS
jgi:hypothetical protein